jgi:hypothetical protein
MNIIKWVAKAVTNNHDVPVWSMDDPEVLPHGRPLGPRHQRAAVRALPERKGLEAAKAAPNALACCAALLH